MNAVVDTVRFQISPPLLAIALAFWGWQTRNVYAAAGFALALLLPVMTQLRLDLSERDKHRISDLTMILYVAVAASFIATDGLRAGVHLSLVWLPGVVLPLLLAQVMCVEGRVPMTALFRYLRKLKARGRNVGDPPVDLTGAYLALILIASGMANQPGYGYFAGLVLIVAAALYRIKPSRVGIAAWVMALGVAAAAGFGGHAGLYALQTLVEDWIIDWQFNTAILDPYRSSTRIGELGRLKFEDAIVMRVYAPREGSAKPALLHRASYNRYSGTAWLARKGNLEALASSGDGTVFKIGDGVESAEPKKLRVTQRVQGGRTLLALPLNTSAVADLVASRVRSNPYGTVQAEMEVPWTFFSAVYGPPPPVARFIADEDDLHVPERERRALESIVLQLGLTGLPAAEVARRVEAHFAGFEYTTVRDQPFSNQAAGNETPLSEFLLSTHRGHCEYFATAATLLMRAAGIPARYVTGYAIGDWSALEGAWIVRERHSHAWARVLVDGRWTDLDTTPAVWFDAEDSLAPAWQRLADFFRWAGFRWTTRDDSETKIVAWAVVALAFVILVWKLVSEGGLVRLAQRASAAAGERPGSDSEFYALEAALAKRVPRRASEALLEWLPRAADALPPAARAELARLASLHYRYRFDPAGLDAPARAELSSGCGALSNDMQRTQRHA